jgi:transposase-like protein
MVCCPYCVSTYGRKKGIRRDQQRYECYSCGKYFQKPVEYEESELPKILLFDVETSFYHFVGWGTYKQYIQHYQITEHQYIISWAAKWLYDDDVQSDVVTPEESKNRDDNRILQSIWKLLDEADIVVGHNGDRFDLRKLRWRFISHGMAPPSPFKIIDTLKIARREFFAPSYKQDFLTKYFKLENKVLMEDDICPTCGSKHLEETNSVYFTSANKFPVYRCEKCETPYIRGKRNIGDHNTRMRSLS